MYNLCLKMGADYLDLFVFQVTFFADLINLIPWDSSSFLTTTTICEKSSWISTLLDPPKGSRLEATPQFVWQSLGDLFLV